jgi:hypothetical protein
MKQSPGVLSAREGDKNAISILYEIEIAYGFAYEALNGLKC